MKSMIKPSLFLSLICALVFNLSQAQTCIAGFANPLLGNNNVYMLSAASGTWDEIHSSQIKFEGVADPVFRFAEWPGSAPGVEAISLGEFLSLWDKGGVFIDLDLVGTLSILNGHERTDYKVLVRSAFGKAEDSIAVFALDFGDAPRPGNFSEATLIIKDWHGPAEETVQLNLISQRLEDGQQVVVFQENLADQTIDSVVAWKTIYTCQQCSHPFEVKPYLSLDALDVYGNFTSSVNAEHGQFFSYLFDAYSGAYLSNTGSASDPSLLQVENDDTHGAVTVRLVRSGKLLATESAATGQVVSFGYDQAIYLGVASNVEEGSSIPLSDIASLVKIPLANIKSADLRMSGNQSTGFTFSLENVEWR